MLAEHGVYMREICEKCGKILGPIRFIRYREPGEWCSRLCRDGVEAAERHSTTRKGGRPRKYRNDREPRIAERQQHAIRQKNYRERRRVTENPLVTDSFHVSTEAENRPSAIPIAGERT